MTDSPALSRLARATWTHVAFAFLAMGAWAAVANRTHGLERALTAGLVQGLISGAVTWGLKRSLEAMTSRWRQLD